VSEEHATRPPVAVVLPFVGTREQAAEALEVLGGLETADGDELVLADNTREGAAAGMAGDSEVRVVECEVKASAYAARNIGAERTAAPWLLFIDADCEPPPGLLDAYFRPEAGERCGALAGPVVGDPDQPGLIPAYVRSRGHLDQEWQLRHPYRPMAVTANLLVRREAFEAVGGFAEGVHSGADADFCWRLQDAGWELGYRPQASVLHHHRETLRALLAQARRDGSGAPRLARRHPGYPPRVPGRAFVRALAGALGWPLLGRPRRGLFKALDGVWSAAFNAGALADDPSPAPRLQPGLPAVVLLQEFPAAGDPRVAALAEAGAHVEARRRPARADWARGRSVSMRHWEDDNRRNRTRAAGRLQAAAPGATLLVEPGLERMAAQLVSVAARSDIAVETLPADREAAADRIRGITLAP
jgi:GT2 family glycosyltransferase